MRQIKISNDFITAQRQRIATSIVIIGSRSLAQCPQVRITSPIRQIFGTSHLPTALEAITVK